MSASREWVVEGARAAIYSGSMSRDHVEIVTIERLTRTQVVITGQKRRYRRDNLHQVGDHYRSVLMPADDPRVLAVQERETVSRAFGKAKGVAVDTLKWPKDRAEAIAQLEAAAAAIAAALDELRGAR